MPEPVLKISPKKYGGESTIVSMRMSKELLKEIDAIAEMTGRTRNELMTLSLEFALEHIAIGEEKPKEEE